MNYPIDWDFIDTVKLVDALRTLMLSGSSSAFGLGMDLGVLSAFALVFIFIAAKLYPTILR
ncbi:hypothetical protein [Extensimonas vulgaris]|uniref:hypothetical protein n=1 Tax=Extensimonas vulgaris TaxID=1031594 RepID=UPI0011A003CC|nr:hypothetical protein [Extensimonas vulgaris]TXD12780.1 hypothetical protein FUT63_13505 [Extensimonas vulgaris]